MKKSAKALFHFKGLYFHPPDASRHGKRSPSAVRGAWGTIRNWLHSLRWQVLSGRLIAQAAES